MARTNPSMDRLGMCTAHRQSCRTSERLQWDIGISYYINNRSGHPCPDQRHHVHYASLQQDSAVYAHNSGGSLEDQVDEQCIQWYSNAHAYRRICLEDQSEVYWWRVHYNKL